MKNTCHECRWWDSFDNTNGLCKRRAPQPLVSPADLQESPGAFWPETMSGDFCGEFQAPIEQEE